MYMLFLEPSSRGEALDGIEGIADAMVRMFSPGSEQIAYCEILVPPIPSSYEGRINFAAYLGQRAEWQKCTLEDGVNYYLVERRALACRTRVRPPRSLSRACRRRCERGRAL